jgi:hypothetical protein
MQDFIFYNQLTGFCLDWHGMAGGRTRCCLCHDGHVMMFFVVLCGWLGKKVTTQH